MYGQWEMHLLMPNLSACPISPLIASGDDCLKCRRILLYVSPQSEALNQDQTVWHIGSIRHKSTSMSISVAAFHRFDLRYVDEVLPFICQKKIGYFSPLFILVHASMSPTTKQRHRSTSVSICARRPEIASLSKCSKCVGCWFRQFWGVLPLYVDDCIVISDHEEGVTLTFYSE